MALGYRVHGAVGWGHPQLPGSLLRTLCLQSGAELSSRLDTLSAEKDALSGAVRQREAELLAAQNLAREKEAVLSQAQQELQGRLEEKVGAPGSPQCLPEPRPCFSCSQLQGHSVPAISLLADRRGLSHPPATWVSGTMEPSRLHFILVSVSAGPTGCFPGLSAGSWIEGEQPGLEPLSLREASSGFTH